MALLEDFEAYKIISELDGSAIDLADWNVANGAIVKVAKPNSNENQLWVAQSEDEGFQLRNRIQHGRVVKVLFEDAEDKVTHTVYDSSYNQEWILEAAETEGTFYVKCRGTGKYLQNPGDNLQLIVSAEKTTDKSQIWRFIHVPE